MAQSMPRVYERELGDTLPSVPEEKNYPSKMDEIISALNDPEVTDLEGVNRMIAIEIACTLAATSNPYGVRDKVRGLRELAKTLQEGEDIAKKDFLNFDGPKFNYVLTELIRTFKESLKSSGLPEESVNHVLRIFRDTLSAREADLRKETERVTGDASLTSLTSLQGN